jgi:hypothetical protein
MEMATRTIDIHPHVISRDDAITDEDSRPSLLKGEDVEQLISSIYATPRDVIDRARALVQEH